MLGGFHIQLNFAKCIGQYLTDGGMKDVWQGSEMYGDVTSDKILAGKDYNKFLHAHKLSLEALWQLLWPRFVQWMNANGKDIDEEFDVIISEIYKCFEERNIESAKVAYEKLIPLVETLHDNIAQ